ncbi:unnamed protein product [Lactuca virosa]|uniref:Uncharacterized protein n=1 Tax=Lactuca virosa TaxID=75947 RepID=A0AAU9MI20_9ASTR|nr:unnamed protein product [Lactuca virosa]
MAFTLCPSQPPPHRNSFSSWQPSPQLNPTISDNASTAATASSTTIEASPITTMAANCLIKSLDMVSLSPTPSPFSYLSDLQQSSRPSAVDYVAAIFSAPPTSSNTANGAKLQYRFCN